MSNRIPFGEYIRDLRANVERGDATEHAHGQAAHGTDLVALHLLQSPKLDQFITEFPEKGTNEVDRVIFNETTGRVYINATQYFGGIPQATVSDLPIKNQKSAITNPCVWSFRVGGYQVCEKWIKDRKGRTLDYADLQHYQKIVVALRETIRFMTAIDQTIEAQGGWPGAIGGGRQEVLP